jgi:hypothetical protein
MRKILAAARRDMLEAWHNWRYSMASSPDLATLKLEDFAGHLDVDFEMQISGGCLPLKLVKADPAGRERKGRRGVLAAVCAHLPAPSLPQAIYPVTHPTLGVMDIFLVPIGPIAGGSGYQAIFS